MLVNALPLALLVATLLYLDQYQNGLLIAEVGALREQAKIYANAIGESAVRIPAARHGGRLGEPVLAPELARRLLRRLTEPTPLAVARLYGPDGAVIADSNPGAPGSAGPHLPAVPPPRTLVGSLSRLYDQALNEVASVIDVGVAQRIALARSGGGLQWSPDAASETLHVGSLSEGNEMPPYIRRTRDDRLLVTVAEPVRRDGATVGIILLTRAAGEVDRSLDAVRRSILDLFLLALCLTVLLSIYLARTIAGPILSLARAADTMREGAGRIGTVPETLRSRADEIGVLGRALSESSRALWARMDATERFAADVSHEIKNPLSSIASALETLKRIGDPAQRARLLAIIGEDVSRLDRLISDIARASRVDAELSRTPSGKVELGPMMEALAEIHQATRDADAPRLAVRHGQPDLSVLAVEDRLVQVLRNLIGNAASFSPPGGIITLAADARGRMVEISVSDQGPGIPAAKLEHIFDRFYSERPAGEQFGVHSGLGLSISRQIVDALKGRIAAENIVGSDGRVAGARFVVVLPRSA